MAADYPTPEAAHDALISAIEYEIATYGPASLAEVCAVLLENRYDEEDPKPADAYWRDAAERFHQIAFTLADPPK